MRTILGLAVITLTLAAVAARAAGLPPDGWVVYSTPKPGACEWLRANYSTRNWVVSLDNGRLSIARKNFYAPPKPAPKAWPKFQLPAGDMDAGAPPCSDCVMRVDDGWLVGFDKGEWLGRLWWTDPNGRNAYVVSDGGRTCRGERITPDQRFSENEITNILSLMRAGNRVLAISGLMHGDASFGSVSRVEKRGGKWRSCIVSDLRGAPHVVLADGAANWLVLAHKGLFRVDGDGEAARLAHFSSSMSPCSRTPW